MKTFEISIPEATVEALDMRLAQFRVDVTGEQPGETINRRQFPDVQAWLKEIVGRNVAQLVPPASTDPEVADLDGAIENLRKQRDLKANRVQVAAKK